MSLLDLILGRKCEGCGCRGARITICSGCLDKTCTTRDHERHYNADSRCRICGELPDEDCHAFCHKCVPPHPDDTHITKSGKNWWALALQAGGWDHPDGIINIECCPHCGSLLKILQSGDLSRPKRVLKHSYFKIGSQAESEESFVCPGRNTADVENEQQSCSHDWVVVYRPEKKSKHEYVDELSSNPVTREWLGNDDALIETTAESMAKDTKVVMWCWKCGLKEMRNE